MPHRRSAPEPDRWSHGCSSAVPSSWLLRAFMRRSFSPCYNAGCIPPFTFPYSSSSFMVLGCSGWMVALDGRSQFGSCADQTLAGVVQSPSRNDPKHLQLQWHELMFGLFCDFEITSRLARGSASIYLDESRRRWLVVGGVAVS
jgi:hypothetical protein